jgi:hypothetical protein
VVDDSTPEVESDLRRRAAWLLVMLAIVAVLLIVVISAVAGGGNDKPDNNAGPGPLDSAATTASSSPNGQHSSHSRGHHPGRQHPGTGTAASSTVSTVPAGQLTCPTPAPCIIDGDVGNSIQAINDFRVAHGLAPVPGSVSPQAQTCAVNNGNGCTGGWAETLLSHPDGAEAVQKIQQFAHFDDPNMTSIEVGWAYDPGARLYYFAIVRND